MSSTPGSRHSPITDEEMFFGHLRRLTQTGGLVHEIQLEQLRIWPYLYLGDGIRAVAECVVDVKHKTVLYTLEGAWSEDGVVGLEKAVSWLFGDGWIVRIKHVERNDQA